MRSRGPSGASIESRRLDLSFLHSGTTGRDEVVDKLAAINTGYVNPRLFWGRWSESKWGYWWFVTDSGVGTVVRLSRSLISCLEIGRDISSLARRTSGE
jgi:hypothetical protein